MSDVLHCDARWATSTVWRVGKRSIAEYFRGSLVLENWSTSGSFIKTYGESVTKEIMETFLKWANWLPEIAMHRYIRRHSVWIVPMSFCTMHCFNDGSYQPRDDTSKVEKLRKRWKNNAEFFQMRSSFKATFSCHGTYWLLGRCKTWSTVRRNLTIAVAGANLAD